MKVLHLTTSAKGGAGIAATRLIHALKEYTLCDIELKTRSDFEHLGCPLSERIQRHFESFLSKHRTTTNPIFHSLGLCSHRLTSIINQSDADIVHLHWINGAFLSIRDILKIKKTLVWTLHDSWPFCGTEHHPNILESDQRYIEGYKTRNFPQSSRGIDLDKWIWRWKCFCWKNLKCHFIAPSRWEAKCFEESALFHGQKCHVIPNTLNTDIFTIGNRASIRKKLHIPVDKHVILFGAMNYNDPIKGSQYLAQALQLLPQKDSIFLLFFGNSDALDEQLCIPGHGCGYVTEDAKMAELYQAADVFVCPSIIESFSLTSLEAEACGTPVVAFNVGGVQDVIMHKKTGYLAQPYETSDLAEGILYCLQNQKTLSDAAKRYVPDHFSEQLVAEKHVELYTHLLKN